MFERLRDRVSGLMHLLAAAAAVPGLVLLLFAGRGDAGRQISSLIYGLSLLLMFSASAAYHLIQAKPRTGLLLRKLDHSAIYLLIAGSYTPICISRFTGFWHWGLLAIVWALAVVGIIAKIAIINGPRWLSAGVYLVMGWLSLAAIDEMLAVLPTGALIWLLLGGVFFTLGTVVYVTKILDFIPGVFGFHETWHVFVILGCLSHYLTILSVITPAA